jgi:hypothetical protein
MCVDREPRRFSGWECQDEDRQAYCEYCLDMRDIARAATAVVAAGEAQPGKADVEDR